jgi:hypothetical protein
MFNRSQTVTFIIPHCENRKEAEEIREGLIKEYGLEHANTQIIFVVDFATAA